MVDQLKKPNKFQEIWSFKLLFDVYVRFINILNSGADLQSETLDHSLKIIRTRILKITD